MFSVLEVEKESKLFIENCVFFSTAQKEKNRWKKMGETSFMTWCFDVTNKIIDSKVETQSL